jgi:hypothetical protein
MTSVSTGNHQDDPIRVRHQGNHEVITPAIEFLRPGPGTVVATVLHLSKG